jgi:hypothetical protein
MKLEITWQRWLLNFMQTYRKLKRALNFLIIMKHFHRHNHLTCAPITYKNQKFLTDFRLHRFRLFLLLWVARSVCYLPSYLEINSFPDDLIPKATYLSVIARSKLLWLFSSCGYSAFRLWYRLHSLTTLLTK